MLIAEELLLIALDPVNGRVPLGSREYVEVGLSGTLLAELAVTGRLEVDGTVVRTLPGDAPSDPLLAETLAFVGRNDGGVKTKTAIRKLDKALGGVETAGRPAGRGGCRRPCARTAAGDPPPRDRPPDPRRSPR